jgi:hypothetical protein
MASDHAFSRSACSASRSRRRSLLTPGVYDYRDCAVQAHCSLMLRTTRMCLTIARAAGPERPRIRRYGGTGPSGVRSLVRVDAVPAAERLVSSAQALGPGVTREAFAARVSPAEDSTPVRRTPHAVHSLLRTGRLHAPFGGGAPRHAFAGSARGLARTRPSGSTRVGAS